MQKRTVREVASFNDGFNVKLQCSGGLPKWATYILIAF